MQSDKCDLLWQNTDKVERAQKQPIEFSKINTKLRYFQDCEGESDFFSDFVGTGQTSDNEKQNYFQMNLFFFINVNSQHYSHFKNSIDLCPKPSYKNNDIINFFIKQTMGRIMHQ